MSNQLPASSLLPETLRNLVGDGSIVPPRIYRPLFPLIGKHSKTAPADSNLPKRTAGKFKNPLLLFRNLDIVLLLVFNGIVYAVYYAVTASISSLFVEIYPFLNDTTIGLCFLSIGSGTAIGSAVTGKLLDWDFARLKKAYLNPSDTEKDQVGQLKAGELGVDFPIEKVRHILPPCRLIVDSMIGSIEADAILYRDPRCLWNGLRLVSREEDSPRSTFDSAILQCVPIKPLYATFQ